MARINQHPLKPLEPVFCGQLNGKGDLIPLTDDTVATTQMPCWLHLDSSHPSTHQWLENCSLLSEIVKEKLAENITVPKEIRLDDGILVVLRGVNMTSTAMPDPGVTLQIYASGSLIVSVRHHTVDSISDVYRDLQKGIGPVDSADWLVAVSDTITDYANEAIDGLHSRVLMLEEAMMESHKVDQHELAETRRALIVLRRYLSPQRDVFARLATERVSWIDEKDRQHMHDISARLGHYIDDLDSSLSRVKIVSDQMNGLLTEVLNQRIYTMTLLALLFLPITLLTSLFGVNLGGIPGAESPFAFFIFVVLLAALGFGIYRFLKKRQWFSHSK